MPVLIAIIVIFALLAVLAMTVKIVKQYEQGVLFRLGRVLGEREPGLRFIVPFVDVLHRVSLRIVTMPIQSWVTRWSGRWPVPDDPLTPPALDQSVIDRIRGSTPVSDDRAPRGQDVLVDVLSTGSCAPKPKPGPGLWVRG